MENIAKVFNNKREIIKEYNLENREEFKEFIISNMFQDIVSEYMKEEEKKKALALIPNDYEIEYLLEECETKGVNVNYIIGVLQGYISESRDAIQFNKTGIKEKEYSNIKDITDIIIFFSGNKIKILDYYDYKYSLLFNDYNTIKTLKELKSVLKIVMEKSNGKWTDTSYVVFSNLMSYYSEIKEEILKA